MTEAHGSRRVAVSSCLFGEPVRHNGSHSRARYLTDDLASFVEWVLICPEMEIGFGTPRAHAAEVIASHQAHQVAPSVPGLRDHVVRRDVQPRLAALRRSP
ncbi:DUF523 domain-containing protein [Nonomuraea sp. LPB2021202275-12-8]|uniref:DUF523 domain-containing protein n=1 Tax=Nonomuraea sp. LPB2021202275-12-8 TaxID=3120159 RepID=UPI00300C0FD1